VPKDIKYANPDDQPDSESKRELNMEYLKEEEIGSFSAKVVSTLRSDSSKARRSCARQWSTVCLNPSRRALTWE
jgi:hypothetical protein